MERPAIPEACVLNLHLLHQNPKFLSNEPGLHDTPWPVLLRYFQEGKVVLDFMVLFFFRLMGLYWKKSEMQMNLKAIWNTSPWKVTWEVNQCLHKDE